MRQKHDAMTRAMTMRRAAALTALLAAIVTSPALTAPPNGVDDDPATVTGRPSNREVRSAIQFVYGHMAAGFGATIHTGPIVKYGRTWKRTVVRIENATLKLRFELKMTETADGFDFYAKLTPRGPVRRP